jgi:hypothetical protein
MFLMLCFLSIIRRNSSEVNFTCNHHDHKNARASGEGGEIINHPTLPHAGLPENQQNTKQGQILPTRETEKPS